MVDLERVARAVVTLRGVAGSPDPAGWLEALEEAVVALGGAGARLALRPWRARGGRGSRRATAVRGFLLFGLVSLPRCGCVGPTATPRAGPCDRGGRPWRLGVRLGPRAISSRRARELEAFGSEALNVVRGLALHHALGAAPPDRVDEGEAVFILDGASGGLRAASALGARLQSSTLEPGEEPLALVLATLARQTFERRAPQRALTPTSGGSIAVQARLLDDAQRSVVLFATRRGGRRPARRWTLAGFGLTSREVEVAERVARGETNREVARALGLSPATVKVHVARIYAKTGLQGRTELAGLLVGGMRPSWADGFEQGGLGVRGAAARAEG